MTKIQLFAENFYILDDGRVRQFLILGEDEALLIDTGFEDSNVYHTVKNITQLPVKVIMTHGDPDHAGGLKDFGKCYLHKGDWPLISEGIQLEPLKEGDVFKCGGYTLETIEIPASFTSISCIIRQNASSASRNSSTRGSSRNFSYSLSKASILSSRSSVYAEFCSSKFRMR